MVYSSVGTDGRGYLLAIPGCEGGLTQQVGTVVNDAHSTHGTVQRLVGMADEHIARCTHEGWGGTGGNLLGRGIRTGVGSAVFSGQHKRQGELIGFAHRADETGIGGNRYDTY